MVETTELYQAILEGRFEIGAARGRCRPRNGPLRPRHPGYGSPGGHGLPPLVGREREMAFLQERYAEAEQGREGWS
jgi:hypothetical protein